MKEFMYKYFQIQLGFVMLITATKQAMFRAIFGINKNKEICVVWQNKGQIKVETVEDQNKIRNQVVKQPNPENNKNFPQRLVMELRRQMKRG